MSDEKIIQRERERESIFRYRWKILLLIHLDRAKKKKYFLKLANDWVQRNRLQKIAQRKRM
jgi:hypothetical protein